MFLKSNTPPPLTYFYNVHYMIQLRIATRFLVFVLYQVVTFILRNLYYYLLWIKLYAIIYFTFIKQRQARRFSSLMNDQGRLLITRGPLKLLWLLIMIMEKIEFSAGSTFDYFLHLSLTYELGSRLCMFIRNSITTWNDLSFVILVPKYILVFLLSFGVMFTFTSYLVVLTLKLNRKRVRCRVNSRN